MNSLVNSAFQAWDRYRESLASAVLNAAIDALEAALASDLSNEARVHVSGQARKALAWEEIEDEQDELRLDDGQKRQLAESKKKAQRDLKEAVWRSYKHVLLLAKDNSWKGVDLGLVHSSAALSMMELIVTRLRQDGDIEDGINPNFLARNWPPAFKEWSSRAVRDTFFAFAAIPAIIES